MKKTMTFLAAACALTLLPLNNANADCNHARITGYTPCGQPIYAYFHVHGYDRCGNPVGHWVSQYPNSCRCRSGGGHSHSGHHHGSSHRPSSGWNFFFRF